MLTDWWWNGRTITAATDTASGWHTLNLVLLILAAACFLIAAVGVTTRRVNALALGALFAVLVPLIAVVRR